MFLVIEFWLKEYKEGIWEIGEDDWLIFCCFIVKELFFFGLLINEEEENNGCFIYLLFCRIEVCGFFFFKKGVVICEYVCFEYMSIIYDFFK